MDLRGIGVGSLKATVRGPGSNAQSLRSATGISGAVPKVLAVLVAVAAAKASVVDLAVKVHDSGSLSRT